jgi:hypothetical protein
MGRSNREDNVLQALMSQRTVYGYLSDAAFSARYRAARNDAVREVANSLRERMGEAVGVIAEIMGDHDAPHRERRAAACAILDYGAKFTETLDILERLQALESKAGE